jgi:hypothetical protein
MRIVLGIPPPLSFFKSLFGREEGVIVRRGKEVREEEKK